MLRYSQQEIVPEIGKNGQEKLKNAKVLIIGAGGLGTPLATYLTATGIGKIGIIDGDVIGMSNLNRQFLFDDNQIGKLKVDILSEKLRNQNSDVQILNFNHFLTNENNEKIIADYDIICDCTDNLETRMLLDKTTFKLSKPLIYAAVKDWEGYITILNYKKKVRLSTVFSTEELYKNEIINCSTVGIVNSTCGIAASIQATEVIKIILKLGNLLDGKIMCFNSLEMIFKKYNILT